MRKLSGVFSKVIQGKEHQGYAIKCELPEQLTRFGRELVIQILYQSGFFNTFCGIAVEKSGAMWYYLAG